LASAAVEEVSDRMQASNSIAFKEWAAVCAALAAGRQTVILRKGGIHEGREGFRVAHREFWLFPTYLHEAAGSLEPDAAPLLEQAESQRPAEGTLRLALYVETTDVIEVHDESALERLAGQHVWSARTVHERFHYKRAGLFALVVRAFERAAPHVVADSPHFGGCRSWVELPVELPTTELSPVLAEADFENRRRRLLEALSESATI
jgi:hypothetical protein